MNLYEKTILIVDESAEARIAYRQYLAEEFSVNYQIIEAGSGEEGLRQIALSSPDLILLDYLLPDLNALEFIKQLKFRAKQVTPIIILTGQVNEIIAVELMKNGAKDYLIKGQLTPEILTSSVKNVLQQHNLQSLLSQSILQQKLIAETALRIRQSQDLAEILETAVREIQLLLNCDRVVIYQFESSQSGNIVAESVKQDWQGLLSQKVIDTCLPTHGTKKYTSSKTLAIDNIQQFSLAQCHSKLPQEFEVQANAVAPIVFSTTPEKDEGDNLWGFLIAHQSGTVQHWQASDVELLEKLAVQIAIAIQQAKLINSLNNELDNRKKLESELVTKAKDLEQINQKLIKTRSLLEERNQELDRFAYVTSHDLKAPLRAIANLATWLSEDLAEQIPPENQEQLKLMQSRVQRMDGLIQGLLEYSRVGRKNTIVQIVNVKSLLDQIIESLCPPPKFKITLANNLPTFITAKLLLEQVFTNLIGNAIKYNFQSEGQIEIAVEEQEDFYQFAVADNGLGIDPQYHERIFTIFQTLQSRDSMESTGIGLSIVKKIVESQGGRITVKSQLGAGATFYFTWRK